MEENQTNLNEEKVSTKIAKILLTLGGLAFIFIVYLSCSQTPQVKKSEKDLNATMINIHGTSDNRLQLFFMSIYRPVYPSSKQGLPEECLNQSANWTTGTKKPKLKFEGITVEGKDDYNITIPVFNKDLRSKCTYEFAGISVRISRIYDDVLYAQIPILTDVPMLITSGHRTGMTSYPWDNTLIKKPKDYFRIPNETKVACFTTFYEYDAHSRFTCRLNHREIHSEVERVEDDSIELDIDVDDNLSRYIFKSKKLSTYNYKKGKLNKEEESLFLSKQGQFKEVPTPAHIKIKKLFIGE